MKPAPPVTRAFPTTAAKAIGAWGKPNAVAARRSKGLANRSKELAKSLADRLFHTHYEFGVLGGTGKRRGKGEQLARGASVLLASFALALVLVGPAASGTRQQQTTQKILSDLADNGRLDRRYKPAQIYRALDSLETYEKERRERKRSAPKPPAQPSASADRASLPFSGLDLALFGAVGLPLLLIGASLGHVVRVKPQGEPG